MVGLRAGVRERERELMQIELALDAAMTGNGSVVVIEGEPGIGKTALIAAARDLASAREVRVLSARANEFEEPYPYGVVRQLLDPVLRTARGSRRAQLLQGAGAAAALWPALASSPTVQTTEFHTLSGLWWLIANLSDEQPLLVAVDDVHWADRASLRMLEFLAARAAELPLTVLVAARTGGCDLTRLAAHIPPALGARPLAPAPLSPAACAALVRERFANQPIDDGFCAACHEASAGNPFYLHALLDQLARDRVEPGTAMAAQVVALRPRSVARAIAARTATLSSAATGLARALAVLGDGAASEHAAPVANLRDDVAADAVQELARAGICISEGSLRFTHPIVRATIYDDLGPAERDNLHRQAAGILKARGAAIQHIAGQLLHCQPRGDAEAAAVLEEAADRALARGAYEPAVAYLRRAIKELPPGAALGATAAKLGRAELLTDVPAAIEHLREALSQTTAPHQRAAVADLLSHALIAAGDARGAAATAQAALATLADDAHEQRHRLQAAILTAAMTDPSLDAERRQTLATLEPLDDQPDTGARALQARLAYDDARQLDDSAPAVIARVTDALADDQLLIHDNGGAYFQAAILALIHADSPLALQWLQRSETRAREQGQVFALACALTLRCLAQWTRGELSDAMAAGAQALELLQAWGVTIGGWLAGYLAPAHIDTGDLAGAQRTLAGAPPPEDQSALGASWQLVLDGRARLLWAQGQTRECLRATLVLGKRFQWMGPNPAYSPWRSRAALCLARLSEDQPRARTLAAEEVDLARRWGAPRALGHALRAQALVTAGDEGERLLREAIDILQGSDARLEHAYALVDLGALLRRNGERARARPELRTGLDLARRCGAVPLAQRAYDELRATGASPRKLIRTGAETLTPSERRIAQLAATGNTNRQIAQQLYVTIKTVEAHLAQSYRKLDIQGRNQLADKLNSHGSTRARVQY